MKVDLKNVHIGKVGKDVFTVKGDNVQIDADNLTVGEVGDKFMNISDGSEDKEAWYKKPIGLIGVGVTIVFLGAVAIWVFNRYFPEIGL